MSNFADVGDVTICYDTFGNPGDPALLLVMGFTAQMIAWDEGFCSGLAEHGLHVVRFDNRDCGLSSKIEGTDFDPAGFMAAQAAGGTLPTVPYSLADMAADGIGLLDALGIGQAHIVGASMGGMIVQQMAIDHPTRVLSMTSIMSTTGNPDYFQSSDEAMANLLAPPPADRDGYVQASTAASVWSSRRYFDADRARERAAVAFDRSFYPEGAGRQMAAIAVGGDREAGLVTLDIPTLVIHGRDDTLIMPSGGERTAELVPGSTLLLVGDMGHDLPEPLWPLVTGAIAGLTRGAAG